MRGASPRPHPAVEKPLALRAADGGWPGAVYATGPPAADPGFLGAVGRLALEPELEPARVDALYDLASLTKPLAVAALALRFASRGLVDIEEPLQDWLPELASYAGRTPSLLDLLAHRAGFPAWAPLYAHAPSSTEDLAGSLAALEPAYAAGEDARYSCPSAIAAGLALERIGGRTIDALFASEIAAPLGLESDLRFGPLPESEIARTAPTERSRRFEARLVRDQGFDGARAGRVAPGPELVLRGVVHDGNAAALGGVAGNAGLFGTAAAVFRLASEMAVPGTLFGSGEAARLMRVCTGSAADARTFGFQSGRAENAPAGAFGEASVGHAGFTGTSLWMRDDGSFVAVLLTNRVHPVWRDVPIQGWRRAFHDSALAGEARS